jgi:hypothetical protein
MPRSDPFSPHDQGTIIVALKSNGEWTGTRVGFSVRFVRYTLADRKEHIEWSMKAPGWRSWTGAEPAITVGEAISQCNRAIIAARAVRVMPSRKEEAETPLFDQEAG